VTQGLDHRPLTVDAAMLAPLGHGPDPLDGPGPVVPQLPPPLRQVDRIVGPDQQPHRVPAVELGLDVRRHLDPVHYETGNQAVYLGVLHDHADQPGPAEVALAELGASEVLVIEASHTDRLGSGLVAAEWHPNRMLGVKSAGHEGSPYRHRARQEPLSLAS